MKGRSNSKPIPYVAFTTFLTALDKLRTVGSDVTLRREDLNPGSYASWDQLARALSALDLVDDRMRPTLLLKALIIGDRKSNLARILKQHYGGVISNLSQTTPRNLDRILITTYGIRGTTVTKARSFLLGAARYCGLPISPELAATIRHRASRKQFDSEKNRRRDTNDFRAVEPKLSPNKTLSLTADDITITVSFRRGSLPEIGKTEHELMAHLFSELQVFTARAKRTNRHLNTIHSS